MLTETDNKKARTPTSPPLAQTMARLFAYAQSNPGRGREDQLVDMICTKANEILQAAKSEPLGGLNARHRFVGQMQGLCNVFKFQVVVVPTLALSGQEPDMLDVRTLQVSDSGALTLLKRGVKPDLDIVTDLRSANVRVIRQPG